MNGAQPLVSIITACFNARPTIGQAIDSVRSQTYQNIEYIIIDGGSSDGTVEIIKGNANAVSFFISEPDNGIADAWNKGLARAKGSIVGLLNADDALDPRAVETIVAGIGTDERVVTYGITKMFEHAMTDVVFEMKPQYNKERLEYGFGFMHTSCFTTRIVYDIVGGFDTRYRIAIDTDFLLRCIRAGIPFKPLCNVVYMRSGGLSDHRVIAARIEYYGQLLRYGYPPLRIGIAAVRFAYFELRRRVVRFLKHAIGKA